MTRRKSHPVSTDPWPHYYLWQGTDGWRWKFLASRDKVLALCPAPYDSRESCEAAIASMRQHGLDGPAYAMGLWSV